MLTKTKICVKNKKFDKRGKIFSKIQTSKCMTQEKQQPKFERNACIRFIDNCDMDGRTMDKLRFPELWWHSQNVSRAKNCFRVITAHVIMLKNEMRPCVVWDRLCGYKFGILELFCAVWSCIFETVHIHTRTLCSHIFSIGCMYNFLYTKERFPIQ